MIDHRVKVVKNSGDTFEGVLVGKDASGVMVHNAYGLNDVRKFIPWVQISEIIDMGRAP